MKRGKTLPNKEGNGKREKTKRAYKGTKRRGRWRIKKKVITKQLIKKRLLEIGKRKVSK